SWPPRPPQPLALISPIASSRAAWEARTPTLSPASRSRDARIPESIGSTRPDAQLLVRGFLAGCARVSGGQRRRRRQVSRALQREVACRRVTRPEGPQLRFFG